MRVCFWPAIRPPAGREFLRQYALVVLVGLPAPLTRKPRQARKGAAAAGAWATGSGGRGPPLFLSFSWVSFSPKPDGSWPATRFFFIFHILTVCPWAFRLMGIGIFLPCMRFLLAHSEALSDRLQRSLPMFGIPVLA